MSRVQIILGLLVATFSSGNYGCGQNYPVSDNVGEIKVDSSVVVRINSLADDYHKRILDYRPEYQTWLGIPDADYSDITDISPEARKKWEEFEDSLLVQVEQIDPSGLIGTADWLTLGFLKEALIAERQMRVCRKELWSVSQGLGWQAYYPDLASVQPVGTEFDREAALKRFGALPAYVDQEIENLREGIRLGYTAPVKIVERVLDQLDGLLTENVESSVYYSPAQRDTSEDFKNAFALLITESINPAIMRYRDFLRKEYLPIARMETAVSAIPNGEDCYKAMIRTYTSLDMPAQEIHDLGLEQMQIIAEEIKKIGANNYEIEDVSILLQKLRSEEDYFFDSREEIQSKAENAVARAKDEMTNWFGRLPQADVIVEPIPEFKEASSSMGYYRAAAEDGSRPGAYMINLGNPESQQRALLEAVAFHESIPGHHLELTLAMERPQAHPITTYLGPSSFSEGWALYAEFLADEMGLYSSDLDRLGMLGNRALRAARLVVDTGLHTLSWTREEAIDYLSSVTMLSREQVTTEVDRYISVPGQATSYMIGSLEINRLRTQAEKVLGEDFDIKEFHDLVLADGSVTLPMLQSKVNVWITETQK